MSVSDVHKFPSAKEAGVMVGAPPPPAMLVTLDNWQQPPWNRWGFLHTREVIPSARISTGDQRSTATFGRRVEPLGDIEFESAAGDAQSLTDFLFRSWTDGMLVLQAGDLLFEAYRNDMSAATRHIMMSVSKSVTSLLVGVFVGNGQITLQEPVTTYLPELANTAYNGATVQHLLDMAVSMRWREDYVDPNADFWRLDVACGWLPLREGAAAGLFDFALEMEPESDHGRRIQYASINPDLLGLIVERVAMSRLADVVSAELWGPLGMEFEGDLLLDRRGMSVCDGGFCIALRDAGRIGQLFLNRGVARGQQVVPEAWTDACRRRNSMTFDPTSVGADWEGASYRNQWWHLDDRCYAIGIHGQMIAVDDRSDLVVVFTSSSPDARDEIGRLTQRRIVDAIAAEFR
jgi:CubicO group peptidase (beta-lactamase class C family)